MSAGRSASPLWLLLGLLPAVPVAAQQADALDRVQVLGQRQPLSRFPGAVTVLDANTLRDGQRQLSLAESLQQAPGVLALERHNFAQDLQVQSRGFGARSTFGIRGIELVANGIPASALDGQGQAASFALGTLDRIEVLRGPLALVHGNAAGGAIIGESVLDGTSGWRGSGWLGANDSRRFALRMEGHDARDAWRWRAHASDFSSDGHRPHSAARLRHAGLVLHGASESRDQWRITADVLQQPWTQDPLGLTRSQWQHDPFGTDAAASTWNTRKRVDNRQAGLRWSRAHGGGDESWINAHAVQRQMQQFLAIPPGAQMPPRHSGGMIDLQRSSAGIGVGHRWQQAQGAIAVGLDLGRLDETRKGYENFIGDELGVRGRLRRDERNRIDSTEAWMAWERRLGPDWSVLAAARHGRMRFVSNDRYITPGNPDDSGQLRFAETAAALGITRALGRGEWFASLGRGYETPTVTELAYRPDGAPGFNTALRPARHASAETGLRWRGATSDASATVYRIDGRHEIVPALSSGGRASFANAGRTRRDGVELALRGDLGPHWSWQVVGNALRAHFIDTWSSRVLRAGVVETRTVPAGNRVPGIPRMHGFAELGWRDAARQWGVAVQAAGNSAISVDDANSDAAPGHMRLALVGRWRSAEDPGWHGFVRVDNLDNRRAVGSVIVNEGNGRFFEPSPGRGLTIGIGWSSAAVAP